MMKNRYILFLCFALCATLTSFAQTFTVDGLDYEVTSTNPNEVTLTGGTPPTSDLVIPDIVNDGINDFTVVALGNNAFESAGLTSVSFPNTLRALGQLTFRFNSLTTVTIPEGITDIPQRCFSNNDLVSVTLPENLEFIRFRAFENNPLTTMTFPENVTSITSLAFLNNPLNAITSLNTTPPSIQGDTFSNRQNIDLTVPDTTEDAYATAGWTSFKTVNGEIPLQIGSIFEVDGLAFEIISLTPNEVRATGGSAIPANLVLPETVSFQEELFTLVALGNSAFESAGLTSVSFPNTLRALGQVTFRFNSLTTVTIPEGITDIPQRCFSNNDLISVTLPNSIETIGFRSFENNDLTSLVLPENVTSIAQFAFTNAPLTSVNSLNPTPPSVVTGAGNNDSFTNEANIDLTIPEGTEAAYEAAGWTGFNTVNGIEPIEVGSTFDVDGLLYTITALTPNEVNAVGGTSIPTNLILPETVIIEEIPFTVIGVGNTAFQGSGLTNVTLPNTIRSIGSRVFNNNPLTTVIVDATTPPSVVTGANDSFSNRGSIDLTIPVGTQLEYINNGWTGFATINGEIPLDIGNTLEVNGLSYRITALNPTEVEAAGGTSIPTNLVLPETVTIQEIVFTVIGVGDGAFTSSGLTSVTFPTTIRTIGSLAFRFNALTSVVIPEGVTDLPNRCFASNDLTSVTFPTSLETIGFRSFESNNLTSLLLPENLVSIGQLAFGGSINSINSLNPTPPSVVLGTGDDSFGNENNIDLTVPDGTEAAYEAAGWVGFNTVNGIEPIEVGSTFDVDGLLYTITALAPNEVNAVGGTSIPTNLILPETVIIEEIPFTVIGVGNSAFQDSGLTNVTLSNTIRSIGSRAFNNNPLSTVTVNATIPPSVVIGTNDSFGNRDTIDITVPDGTEDAYLAAEWTGFRSINGDVAVGQILTVGDLQYEVTSSNPNTVKVLNRVTTSQNILIPETVADPTTTTLFDVTVIDNEAFEDTDIMIVTIGSRIQTIGTNAFNTTTLTQIEALGTIPATIEENSFGTRENIVLLIPENTETDYENAGWTGFFSVNGEGVAIGNTFSIGGVRYSIISLSPNAVSAIDKSGAIPNNDFIFPEVLSIGGIDFSITTIGNSAFRNEGVNSVHFPSTLTTFEFRAFRDNGNLTTVTFPENVTTIGTEAFLNNGLTEVISNALVPPTISNSAFGSRSGIDLFVPEGTTQAYLDAGWTGFASVTEFTIDITVAPKVFLQGASLNPIAGEEDLMRDSLRENGLLPTTSPYGDGATVNPTVFDTTGANAIVDWVLVELRTGADNENTTVVNSTSAFLQRDGDVVDVDGMSTITFTEEEGDYFIAIKHRNHIGVLAAVPAPLSSTVSLLDFTQDPAFAKGENLALTTLVNGTFAMIAGDADGSSQILNTDITEGLTLAGGGEGYSNADVDMNGFVLNSDIQLLILGNSGTVQQFN